MVYRNHFVCAIKADGNVLRERDGAVQIPFGVEYSILLKNLSTVRALASVTIDGQEATGSTELIIPANGSIDLERFIRNGNLQSGNRFKFIKRTDTIEQHRGIRADDGLIRVEYRFEKPYVAPEVRETHTYHHDHYYPRPDWVWPSYRWDYDRIVCNGGSLSGSTITTSGLAGASAYNASASMGSTEAATANILRSAQCNMQMSEASLERSVDPGITVAGSESNQQFSQGSYFPTESQSHVIVLRLVGQVAGRTVKKSLTVRSKPQCETCGKTNKSSHKFCQECGTALQLI